MEPLEGGAMLEEAYLWGGALGVYSLTLTLHPLSISPSCPHSAPSEWKEHNQPASYLLLLAIMDSSFGTISQNKISFLEVAFGHPILLQQQNSN